MVVVICQLYHNFSEYRSDTVRPLVMSTAFVGAEIVRTGMSLLPFLSVGFLIMSTFAITTVCINAVYMRQFSADKIYLALMACVCPLMACASALGLLFWCGVRFGLLSSIVYIHPSLYSGSILCVTPFLVMAIGLLIFRFIVII
jgi:hypothetical protein